jgi:hypothetical protein
MTMNSRDTRRHAIILPHSAGSGLGQQTGGNVASDTREAIQLIEMMAEGYVKGEYKDVLSDREAEFLREQTVASTFKSTYSVTGKQLFWLRDIKDKLVERGVL